jgi:GST-like protein
MTNEINKNDLNWIPPSNIEVLFSSTNKNRFFKTNSSTSGSRYENKLPCGKSSVQFYSQGTPNGFKVSILFEELGIDYDAFYIDIDNGEQFSSDFVKINPNSKIPCCIDLDGFEDGEPMMLFESASIVLYFADKYKKFQFEGNPRARQEMLNWIFWQMANQGPATGNFGHFYIYGPPDKYETRDYCTARYGMEVQRLCDVLDKHLEGKKYIVNDEYSIADMIILPWFLQLRTGYWNKFSKIAAKEFLGIDHYLNLNKWADRIILREPVQRGLLVCKTGNTLTKPWILNNK